MSNFDNLIHERAFDTERCKGQVSVTGFFNLSKTDAMQVVLMNSLSVKHSEVFGKAKQWLLALDLASVF